jgi:L-alanine-DL-glutamate epimerase-like enolase superfamily enzyme
MIHRVLRPRGGANRALPYGFGEAIDQALWDLAAQQAGLPLYRYLDGSDPRVHAYASGLDFHLTDADYVRFFRAAHALGFHAFKIRVGHPDLAWDLKRLRLLQKAVGPGATVMVDANEAWTPKEAIRRLHAYRDSGFDILWIEDPCLRDDDEGLRQVSEAVPFAHINTGEYLDLAGKRRLIAARGVDILNVHGRVSDVLRAAPPRAWRASPTCSTA